MSTSPGNVHVVEAGETISRIARKYGLIDWRRIYFHPQNAELRKLRPIPQLLAVGDEVFVPLREPKSYAEPTGNEEQYVFTLASPTEHLRVRLIDGLNRPLANVPFKLQVESHTIDGFTTENGVIDELLLVEIQDSAEGSLDLWAPGIDPQETDASVSLNLRVGELQPTDTPIGQQIALANLGFYDGPIDGDLSNPDYQKAASQFAESLGPKGIELDDPRFADALNKNHLFGQPPLWEIEETEVLDKRPALATTHDRPCPVTPNIYSTVCVELTPVYQIQDLEDLSFHFDSPVLLPAGTPGQTGDDSGGLNAIVSLLETIKNWNEHELVVAGHTDTKGSAKYNEHLSQQRADNVYWILAEDADSWSQQCFAEHRVEDLQAVLAFFSTHRSYPCSPGTIDNKMGPKTREALESFRKSYSEEFGKSPAEGPNNVDDWNAFFQLYQEHLKESREGLELKFANPPTLGCGESYPIDDPHRDNRRSAENRRVEIIAYHPARRPDLAKVPTGAGIYGEPTAKKRYIPNKSNNERKLSSDLHIQLLDTPYGKPLANHPCFVALPKGTVHTATDVHGKLLIEDIEPGDYELSFETDGSPISVLVPSIRRGAGPFEIHISALIGNIS